MKTMQIPNMIEKTLRYPGTVEYMKVLRACGFFDKEEIDINGKKIKPLDLTAKLLFPKWKLKAGEEEFTVMRVICEGLENGKKIKHTYDLFDVFDKNTNTTSMARTTGYTCTAALNLLAENKYSRMGISPPEFLGENEDSYKFIRSYLADRNIVYKHKTELI
jgi:saccharopine dehydrogenase-like NADP-dependent oxidoreductase